VYLELDFRAVVGEVLLRDVYVGLGMAHSSEFGLDHRGDVMELDGIRGRSDLRGQAFFLEHFLDLLRGQGLRSGEFDPGDKRVFLHVEFEEKVRRAGIGSWVASCYWLCGDEDILKPAEAIQSTKIAGNSGGVKLLAWGEGKQGFCGFFRNGVQADESDLIDDCVDRQGILLRARERGSEGERPEKTHA